MDTIVLYPSLGAGHLHSVVEFGKLVRRRHPSLHVIVLITSPSFDPTPVAAPTAVADDPFLTFHTLAPVSPPRDPSSYPMVEALVIQTMACNNQNVHSALTSFSSTHTVLALVIDIFCSPSTEVAADLGIPLFFFISSGACATALFLHMPTVDATTTSSFKDLDCFLRFPGLPPIHAGDMPVPILDRESLGYVCLVDYALRLANSVGIISNTFQALEVEPLAAIAGGRCTPGAKTPPHFAVGPLVKEEEVDGEVECLKWLDRQPDCSVIFLCFGSYGAFSPEQVREIAEGLERSGQRFLWVARGVVLPEGFAERTGVMGLVAESWVPQAAVLRHVAVGGFVTHCGWNSVLEGVTAGVPMVAWPLYAEQRLNRAVMTEEMKVAVAVDGVEGGLVTAEEVERRVRQVMEHVGGKAVRERVLAMKAEAEAALAEGGSSLVALEQLVRLWKGEKPAEVSTSSAAVEARPVAAVGSAKSCDADGIIDNDEEIPNIKRALEEVANVSNVTVETTLGNTAVELQRRATSAETGAASSLVEKMISAGFRLHTLSLSIDWGDTVDEVEEERQSRIHFYKMFEELCD